MFRQCHARTPTRTTNQHGTRIDVFPSAIQQYRVYHHHQHISNGAVTTAIKSALSMCQCVYVRVMDIHAHHTAKTNTITIHNTHTLNCRYFITESWMLVCFLLQLDNDKLHLAKLHAQMFAVLFFKISVVSKETYVGRWQFVKMYAEDSPVLGCI